MEFLIRERRTGLWWGPPGEPMSDEVLLAGVYGDDDLDGLRGDTEFRDACEVMTLAQGLRAVLEEGDDRTVGARLLELGGSS